MPAQPGQMLSHYRLVEKIGEGGMGVVYRAADTKLRRDIAIKILPDEFSRDRERLVRFEREARAASALNHPNIITIYHIGRHGTSPYIAMEYVRGTTLRDLLLEGPLLLKDLLDLAKQLAGGVAKAHSAGIVHRDLKPENLMVTEDGLLKILDFGLAKLAPQGESVSSDSATTAEMATRPGVVLGTISYMSPEQAKGQMSDSRSDQFSLGSILYEMASGKQAFCMGTPMETISAILRDTPEPLVHLNPNLPGDFCTVVDRCLAKVPEARFTSTQELATKLRDIRDHWRISKKASPAAPTRPPGTIRSLAVLPLANLSADPEQEFFTDGMTEALIATLAKIGSLKVISRTSVMRYKGSEKSLPQIARELSVDSVVEGSVLRAGNRVRITAQLIHAGTDQHLWADSYDRDLRDVLSLQSEVARAIVEEIELKLTSQEKAGLATASPVNPKAHLAYLMGRHHWNKRTKDDLKKSVKLFQQAIDEDPVYALGYAGLADAYNMLGNFNILPPKEAFPLAKKAAHKALEIDDEVSEAHASLGAARSGYDWEFHEAEKDFKRAIELNPGYATARQWYAELLAATGRMKEALSEIEEAQQLDPLSVVIRATAGWIYYLAREMNPALKQYERALELDSKFPLAHLYLGLLYEQQGQPGKAVDLIHSAVDLSGGDTAVAAQLGRAYALAGEEEKAREVLEQLLRQAKETYVSPFSIALVHIGLGEGNEALSWLEKAYEERSDQLVFLNVHPILDPLRCDRRFQELARRIGFEA